MATQGNAQRKRKSAGGRKKATTTSAWKQSAQGAELEVPSGNVALVRPVGMHVFMQRGMIPNVLMPIVNEALKGKNPDMSKLTDDIDEKMISDVMQLFDDATVYCVVEPKVFPTPRWTEEHAKEAKCHPNEVGQPIPIEDRQAVLGLEEDRLWVDEVDFDDKQFIFQFVVGGTRDLEQFRTEQADGVAHLRPVEDVEHEAE